MGILTVRMLPVIPMAPLFDYKMPTTFYVLTLAVPQGSSFWVSFAMALLEISTKILGPVHNLSWTGFQTQTSTHS